MNQQIEAFYPVIGQEAYDLVSVEFTKLWVKVEMIDDVASIGIYCQTKNGNFRAFYDGLQHLLDIFYDMRKTFVSTGKPPFSTATFVLTDAGKFFIDFGYDDISDFGLVRERREVWIKKYLGENAKIQWETPMPR